MDENSPKIIPITEKGKTQPALQDHPCDHCALTISNHVEPVSRASPAQNPSCSTATTACFFIPCVRLVVTVHYWVAVFIPRVFSLDNAFPSFAVCPAGMPRIFVSFFFASGAFSARPGAKICANSVSTARTLRPKFRPTDQTTPQ
jgi:hypothetical protein